MEPQAKPKRNGCLIGGIIGFILTVILICVVLIIIGNQINNNQNTPQQSSNSSYPTSSIQRGSSTTEGPIQTSAILSPSSFPIQSVVQIIARGIVDGQLVDISSGSGSIISPDGLILTNAHVVLSDQYQVKQLVIAITNRDDMPPERKYLATILQADPTLDIAVVRIDTDLDGHTVNRSGLNLPFIVLGNSDDLQLGDAMTILGYPGIGGETITLTRGEVSGFTAEKGIGNRAYIKTSASISGGNSGGMAVNNKMELVGIPTEMGSGSQKNSVVDCRPMEDTNHDGVINDQDFCVPMGGFINALRPINLAMPLVEKAQRGEVAIVEPALLPTTVSFNGGILAQDDFSSLSSGWPTQQDETGKVGYDNGKYFIEVTQTNYYNLVIGGINTGDMIINVKTDVQKSTRDGEYGVLCRYLDDNNFYMLSITENGMYSIALNHNGSWKYLIDHQGFARQSDPEFTQFEASCIGDTFTLKVNGELMGCATDSTISSGDYGMIVGSGSTGGFRVAFDDLLVKQP